MKPFFLSAILVTFLAGSANLSASTDLSEATRLNDMARFLAGMELPGGNFEKLSDTRAFRSHRQKMDKEWAEYEKQTLEKLRSWAQIEIAPDAAKSGLVRYMFSGPDILHAKAAFPEATDFILCGLEATGNIPDLDSLGTSRAESALGGLRRSLGEIIQFSFFRTKDMKTDLRNVVFPGTIPIICVFLARSGQTIDSIELLNLEEDGSLSPLEEGKTTSNAVKIEFRPADGKGKPGTLTYFSTNIANSEVKKSGFLTWLQSRPRGDSYVKAASYLMHKSYFSEIRDHLLDSSDIILQDDSGIPFQHFSSSLWDVTHYGVYRRPIDLFAQRYQPDLRRAYSDDAVKSIDFGTGYRWRKNDSNLMKAKRRPPETTPTCTS